MIQCTKRLTLCLMAIIAFGLAPQTMEAKEKKNGVLRHVVCFKFKDTARASEVNAVVKAFAALEKKITAIKGFEMVLTTALRV